MSAALIITGAPGAGKSSVLEALGTQLEIEGVPYGALESEELARGLPPLPRDVWLSQLAAVTALQRNAGRELMLIVATTEDELELRGVIDAAGANESLVVCLAAAAEVVAQRIAEREPDRWPGKAALIAHARALAQTSPQLPGIDLVISTEGRDAVDAAIELARTLGARGWFTLGAR